MYIFLKIRFCRFKIIFYFYEKLEVVSFWIKNKDNYRFGKILEGDILSFVES